MREQNVSEALKAGLIAGGVILVAQAALLGVAVYTTKRIVTNAAAQLGPALGQMLPGMGPVANPHRGVRHPPHHRRSRLSHRR